MTNEIYLESLTIVLENLDELKASIGANDTERINEVAHLMHQALGSIEFFSDKRLEIEG